MEALLANDCPRPILIVCCTNHALDQFLEGLLEFCAENELIRVGGASKSEILERYNLNAIKPYKRLQAAKRAKIIGMTTTGAAKFRYIIDGVRPRITSKDIYLNMFYSSNNHETIIFQSLKRQLKCSRRTL